MIGVASLQHRRCSASLQRRGLRLVRACVSMLVPYDRSFGVLASRFEPTIGVDATLGVYENTLLFTIDSAIVKRTV